MDKASETNDSAERRNARGSVTAWAAWRLRALFRASGLAGGLTLPLACGAALAAGAPQDRAAASLGVLLVALGLVGVVARIMVRPVALTRWGQLRLLTAFTAVLFLVVVIWAALFARLAGGWPQWPASGGLLAVGVGVAVTLGAAVHCLPAAAAALLTFAVAAWFALGAPSPDPADWRWLAVVGGGVAALALLSAGGWLSRWAARLAAGLGQAHAELRRVQGELANAEQRASFEVDHRHSVERELTLARDAAEGAMRAKTEFLATMSHEIRTPLNGVLPILELLRDTRLSDEQREYVDTAYKSSRHLLRLINDVLDFAKVEAGKLELENIEINLHELVESVTDLMRRAAERKSLVLRVSIDEAAPVAVRGDPIRLRQVLTNLVSNAVKFTDRGSVRVEVKRLRLGRKEVVLRFAVIDTGSGMSPETAQRLFQAFTQADASTTRKHGGSGLGLVICKRLVELMGGQIGVHSVAGEGSTFWFEVPLRRSLKDAPPERRDLEGVRVLTLVKDPVERARLSGMLQHWGMLEERAESVIAATGKLKATAMLGESWAFELVLADARGQEQGVTALVRETRAERRLRGLQFLIGSADKGRAADVLSYPKVTVIDAPIQGEQLKRQLYRVLDVEPAGAWPGGAGAVPEVDEPPRLTLAPFPPPVSAAGMRHRVLLVEDNAINLAVAVKLLQHLGLECASAQDGREALALLETSNFDLVLMDVQMPVMDGCQATVRIRELEAAGRIDHVPIIAMTANAMQGDREMCLAVGMDDYLAKPLDMAVLKATLARWLGAGTLPLQPQGQPATLAAAPGPVPDQGTEPGLTGFELDPAELAAFELPTASPPELAASAASLPAAPIPIAEPDPVASPVAVAEPAAASAPPRAATAGDAVLDQQVLEDLREVMEDEFAQLLRSYAQQAPSQVERIEAAARAGDIEAMVRPAHSLKSSSANVGAMQVSALAREIEQDAREARRTAAVSALPELREALGRAIAAIEPIVAQETAAP